MQANGSQDIVGFREQVEELANRHASRAMFIVTAGWFFLGVSGFLGLLFLLSWTMGYEDEVVHQDFVLRNETDRDVLIRCVRIISPSALAQTKDEVRYRPIDLYEGTRYRSDPDDEFITVKAGTEREIWIHLVTAGDRFLARRSDGAWIDFEPALETRPPDHDHFRIVITEAALAAGIVVDPEHIHDRGQRSEIWLPEAQGYKVPLIGAFALACFIISFALFVRSTRRFRLPPELEVLEPS